MFALPAQVLLLLSLSIFTLASAEPQVGTRVYVNPSKASSIVSRLSAYQASVTAAPQFSSVQSVLSTGIPESAQSELAAQVESFLDSNGAQQGDVYTTKSWYTALPGDVKSYLASVDNAQRSILTATGNSAAPTGLGRVAGMGAGLAGVVGAAMLL